MNKTTNWLLLIIVLVLLFGAGAVLKGIFIYIGIIVFILVLGFVIGYPMVFMEERGKSQALAHHNKIHKEMGIDTTGRSYSAFELALRGCKICLEKSDQVKLEAYKNNKTLRDPIAKKYGVF